MSTWKVTNDMVDSLSSSKLTGALPAIDGSNLTGVSGFPDTTSASDPATDTNPSGGLGTVWTNSTSGETYVCTDATTDANVWTNVGVGSGNIEPYSFNDGGSSYGYFAGGSSLYGAAPTTLDVIDQINFTTDGNATDIANLTQRRSTTAGASSSTHGYAAGGYGGVNGTGAGSWNIVDRIAFASVADATDVGDINYANASVIGPIVGTTNGDKAYFSNYMSVAQGGSHGLSTAVFSKYTMSSNINASVELDLGSCHPTPVAMSSNSLATSTTHCYSIGAYYGGYQNDMSKMSYATEGNATDVGNLEVGSAANCHECTQNTTHGYKFGGAIAGPASSYDDGRISKWSFASDGDATNVGTLLAAAVSNVVGTAHTTTMSSTTHAYTAGGGYYNKTYSISKLNYATEATLVDVGDLTWAGTGSNGGYGSGTDGKQGAASMQI